MLDYRFPTALQMVLSVAMAEQMGERSVVSANACWYFKSVADEAEQASLNVLARHTVASALEAVKNADTSGCDPVPEMIARFKKAH